MADVKIIKSTLKNLNDLYDDVKLSNHSEYYAKLAIIELCGWLEEYIDSMLLTCGTRLLKKEKNKKFLEESIIKRTFGFKYEKNIRPMLMRLFGLIYVEEIEALLETTGELTQLTAKLDKLTIERNRMAHSHLNGSATTSTITTPSVTFNDLTEIYPILEKINLEIQKL